MKKSMLVDVKISPSGLLDFNKDKNPANCEIICDMNFVADEDPDKYFWVCCECRQIDSTDLLLVSKPQPLGVPLSSTNVFL